jgi:hypothetical protein
MNFNRLVFIPPFILINSPRSTPKTRTHYLLVTGGGQVAPQKRKLNGPHLQFKRQIKTANINHLEKIKRSI